MWGFWYFIQFSSLFASSPLEAFDAQTKFVKIIGTNGWNTEPKKTRIFWGWKWKIMRMKKNAHSNPLLVGNLTAVTTHVCFLQGAKASDLRTLQCRQHKFSNQFAECRSNCFENVKQIAENAIFLFVEYYDRKQKILCNRQEAKWAAWCYSWMKWKPILINTINFSSMVWNLRL